jgi:hypothetical protein
MSKIPPFYGNFAGHCWQCSLRSALEHLNPEKSWTWEELDALTNKNSGVTWHFKTCAELPKMGYDLAIISDLDVAECASDLEACIRASYKNGAEYQISNTDIAAEEAHATELLRVIESGAVGFKNRGFTTEDIRQLLEKDYMIIAWVDPCKMERVEGDGGHFVLIYDIDDEHIIFHDSGNEKPESYQPSRIEKIDHFLESAKDGDFMEGLFAIRKRDHV